jgi:UDP-N-acetylmuramate-alanine ligase
VTHLHFVGIAGSGMSALAQYHRMSGGSVSGSDRSFDQAARVAPGSVEASTGSAATRRHLEALGIRIFPQDGSGPASGCDAVIVSTAVEETIADIRAARERGIPILHRSELLARFVRERRTIAVTGTSGKSTVTAMIFEILRGAERDPSVITGGNLLCLQEQGLLGNAWAGHGELLVIEADESDGSLVRYEPWAGVLLNLQRDHKEPEELAEIFRAFRRNTRGPFLMGEDANLLALFSSETASPDPVSAKAPSRAAAEETLPPVRFGLSEGCDVRAEKISAGPEGSEFSVRGVRFRLSCPGLYNVANAIAAIAACHAAGVAIEEMVSPLAGYRGVGRRFQMVARVAMPGGMIEIIDDFAHNPAKIAAALATARERGTRVLAVYQPHGFGPTRFLRDDLIGAFASGLRPEDRLYMPEIFYAGGTATHDISSREIVTAVRRRGIAASFRAWRKDLVPLLATEARAGDVVLVMGARDPSLSEFCRGIVSALERKTLERKAAGRRTGL